MAMERRHQHHIPTEILLAFGERLDRQSLCASLRVCKQFHLTLSRLIWHTFTKHQWRHPSYPITLWTKLVGPFRSKDEEITATRMSSYLQYTQSFEWIDAEYPFAYSAPFTPFPNLDFFRRMPNLVRFSLVAFHYAPLEYALLSILTPTNFPNLQVLALHLPDRCPTTAIDKLYGLFSRLEGLDIRGHWFHGSISDFAQGQRKETWRLKRLTIDRVFIPFLPYCSGLELLSVEPSTRIMSEYMVPHQQEHLSGNVQRLSNLKIITVKENTYEKVLDESEDRGRQGHVLEQLWKRTTTIEDGEAKGKGLSVTLKSVLDQLS